MLRRVCDDVARPIREVNPDIPEPLVAIIDRLLAKDPEERFQTTQEVSELLFRFLAHLQDPVGTLPPDLTNIGPAAGRKIPDAGSPPGSRLPRRTLMLAAGALLALGIPLAVSEATGVTQLAASIVRIATGAGTLVVEVDDPQVGITIDGEDVVITGAGPQEVRLKPGQYKVQAAKGGQVVKQELVTIDRGGRQVVKVGLEPMTSTQPGKLPTDYSSSPEGAISEVQRFVTAPDGFWVNDLAFSPTGTEILCARQYNRLEVYSLQTGQCAVVEGAGTCLAVSPHGDLVATGHFDDGRVFLYDLARLRKIREFRGHSPSPTTAVGLAPNGRYIVSVGRDRTGRLWDVKTGQEVRRFDCDPEGSVATFCPDGRAVLAGCVNLRLFDVESGKETWRITPGYTHSAAFSPCGRWLVTDGSRHTLSLWDARKGEMTRQFVGHTGIVRSVQFLPDGHHIISGSQDRTMRLWNLETGREIARVAAKRQFVTQVVVSPDGRYAASGGGFYRSSKKESKGKYETDGDYDIRLWRLPESVWTKTEPGR